MSVNTLVMFVIAIFYVAANVTHAEAATRGSWSFTPNMSSVTYNNVDDLVVGTTYSNYGSGNEAKIASLSAGTLNTPLANVGVFTNTGINWFSFFSTPKPAGYYYTFVNTDADNFNTFDVYYRLYWTGTEAINDDAAGEFTLNQSNTTQYIQILEPDYGSTTSTTTVSVQVRFSTPLTLDFRPVTYRKIEIIDAITKEIQHEYNYPIGANAAENLVVTQSYEMATGTKIINAYYSYQNGTPYSEIDTIYFNVIDNSYFNATGLIDPLQNPGVLTQNDCNLYEIGCQFQKALMFLFYPSANTLDRFANIWQSLQYKIPFGYVTVTIEQLRSLDTNAAAAFDFGAIPFSNEIFTPFRNLVAGILWAVFAITFYQRRLIRLEI